MLLHRKNDSRDASAMSLSRYGPEADRRIDLDAIQEVEIDQQPLDRGPDPGIEVAALAPRTAEGGDERLDVASVDRTAVGAARKRPENPRRTPWLVGSDRRAAREDRAAARRVADCGRRRTVH